MVLQEGKETANDSTADLSCDAMIAYANPNDKLLGVTKKKEFKDYG